MLGGCWDGWRALPPPLQWLVVRSGQVGGLVSPCKLVAVPWLLPARCCGTAA